LLGAACPSNQSEERKSVIFEAPSDGTDGTESERFQRIITRDESWFFFYYPRDSVWAASPDEPPQRIKHKIDAEKCLVSVLWSVDGIHSLLDVPKETTNSTAFFIHVVMPNLIESVLSRTLGKMLKGWPIHPNNTCLQNSGRAQTWAKSSKAERLAQPAYSSDLAPSDFFLFEYIKGKPSDYNCQSREDHLNAITEFITGVDQEALLSVFEF
jgi:hypothetical protein